MLRIYMTYQKKKKIIYFQNESNKTYNPNYINKKKIVQLGVAIHRQQFNTVANEETT